MDIKAEKLDLIQWLLQLSDENVIAKIKELKAEDTDWWDSLSPAEMEAIQEGIDELDRGEGIPHEQVMEEVRRKFGL